MVGKPPDPLVRVAACGFFGLGLCPELRLDRVLEFHHLVTHGCVVVAKCCQMRGKRAALISPETVGLIPVEGLQHIDATLDVADAIFDGERNYFGTLGHTYT